MNIEQLVDMTGYEGISWDDMMKNRLELYAILLRQWNQKMNLTAVDDPEEIYEKHFLDSMLPLKIPMDVHTVCDVGSGAGFPGLVYAIVKPEWNVTLLEPTGKRCRFLEEVTRQLDLENAEIINARAEELVVTKRESFDLVTARAVAVLPVLAELCIPLVKQNGIFLAMKGERGEQEAEQAAFAVKTLGCVLEHMEKDELLSSGSRVNLYYRKDKRTPRQYPRQYAKIKKNPLRGKVV